MMLTFAAYIDISWVRRRVWSVLAGLFLQQRLQWRGNIQLGKPLLVEHQYHCIVRLHTRRRLRLVVVVFHHGARLHQAVYCIHPFPMLQSSKLTCRSGSREFSKSSSV